MTSITVTDAAQTARPETSRLTRSRVRWAWVFLTPLLIVMALVAGWPLGRTIYFAFTDARLSDMSNYSFVGIDNFYYLLIDDQWWRSVFNTVTFSVISVALETVLGMAVALIINANMPGRGLLRAAVLVPWAIPTVVSAKMWDLMFNDQIGVINHMLEALGLISTGVAWTADPTTAMGAMIMVDVWKTTPFMALLILAGLQLLPGEIYEAAHVDGASPITVFFKITLPLVMPAIMVAVIFRLLDALRIFDLMYVMTGAARETMSMSIYARQQLVDFADVGFGSAASTLLFLIIALITVAYIVFGRVNLSGGK
jgi:trehalose/maltose transport system permease protein